MHVPSPACLQCDGVWWAARREGVSLASLGVALVPEEALQGSGREYKQRIAAQLLLAKAGAASKKAGGWDQGKGLRSCSGSELVREGSVQAKETRWLRPPAASGRRIWPWLAGAESRTICCPGLRRGEAWEEETEGLSEPAGPGEPCAAPGLDKEARPAPRVGRPSARWKKPPVRPTPVSGLLDSALPLTQQQQAP